MSQASSERVAQKQRTRAALLATAREMLREGRGLAVADVADRSNISRATAYRYFADPQVLAEEAVLDAIAGEFERIDLDAAVKGDDAAERAATVVSLVLKMVLGNEAMFRCYLGLVARGSGAKRGARRTGWLRHAVAPLADVLPKKDLDRLVSALSLACGIEAIIVLKDVCGLGDAEVDRTARWTARSLVHGALAGAAGGG